MLKKYNKNVLKTEICLNMPLQAKYAQTNQ